MGTSLEVQWLRLCIHNAEGVVSPIPDWGTKIPNAIRLGQKNKFGIKGGEGHGHSGYSFPAIKRFDTGSIEEKPGIALKE